MKKRNYTISFLKFIFSIFIVIYHCQFLFNKIRGFVLFKRGYLAVEFFFIVSGYYFMSSIEKDEKSKKDIFLLNVKNTFNKLKKFLPITIIAWMMTCLIGYFLKSLKISEMLLSIYNGLLIGMVGIGHNLNVPIWYLSASLITMFILYPIIRANKKRYIYYVAPLIVLFVLGYTYRHYTSLDLTIYSSNNLFYSGMLRCIAELNIGIIIYEFIKWFNKFLKKINDSNKIKKIKIIMQIFEIILYVAIFLFMLLAGTKSRVDYVLLLCIICATTISLSQQTYINKLLSHKIIIYLEQLSLYIYVNQQIIIFNLKAWLKNNTLGYYKSIVLVLLSTIIFSVIEYGIIKRIKKKKIINNIK